MNYIFFGVSPVKKLSYKKDNNYLTLIYARINVEEKLNQTLVV